MLEGIFIFVLTLIIAFYVHYLIYEPDLEKENCRLKKHIKRLEKDNKKYRDRLNKIREVL